MATYRYRVVDVFTENKLEGNPLAVFPDAPDFDDATMQRVARELNLSETVFVYPPSSPQCAARVRIFTPAQEVPFAGHPTVGTAWVLRDEGRVATDHFALEELVGPVAVRTYDDLLWLRTPPVSFGPEYDRQDCASAMGVSAEDLLDAPPQMVSAGNPNIYIALKSREAVDRAWADLAGMRMIQKSGDPICIFVFTPTTEGAYSRMFAAAHGIAEDPATGSATGPLAAYMARYGMCSGKPGTRLVSEQGVKMGRRSLLHILFGELFGDDAIAVGGAVAPIITATMEL